MSETQRDRIVRRLATVDSPARQELLEIAVDHALDQKLSDLVDFEAGQSIVVRALTTDNLARILERHARPGFDRYTERVKSSRELLGDLVPEGARNRIRRILDTSKPPRAKWAQGMVDPALLRQLFGPVWSNLFVSFAKRLPLPGVAAVTAAATTSGAAGIGAGIAERLTRSVQERAEKIVDRGRSAMGSLGAEVEKRVQAAAKDFSDGAAEIWREALSARLKSKEGREIVSAIIGQILDHLMVTKLADLHEDAKGANVSEILLASAEIVGTSVTRRFIGEVITEEVAAFVAAEGERPLRDVLGELGVLDDVRSVAIKQLGARARGIFETPAFAGWLARLLDE